MDKSSPEPLEEHSPTPFHVRPAAGGLGEYIVAANHETIAKMADHSIVDVDAALIVRACNAHDALVAAGERARAAFAAALRRAVERDDDGLRVSDQWMAAELALGAALALARGEAVQA